MTTSSNTYVASLPMVLDRVTARSVQRVSPSVVRIELAGDCLAEFGVPGDVHDQRIKLVFPGAAGTLPSFEGMDESWWSTWLELPEEERGSMRTYTIRDVLGSGTDTRLVVDIVVHEPTSGGPEGAGNAWALRANAGDQLVIICPRRGHEFGGIEWAPGDASRLLIVGDETAAPAIRGVLRDLPADARGAVFLETVTDADVYDDMPGPDGVEVTWLPRNGRPRGEDLHAAAIAHLTGGAADATYDTGVPDDAIDPNLWETPVYSSSGEDTATSTAVPSEGTPYAGLYAWIAGESKVVTGLRRQLVKDLGIDRRQVAFMGYWREGVAMRS
ncbi:siderophore-interacting protein [Nocardioides panacisoli]|uniref:siderophore-interacting protein n=1 Tax=Nocardioides panacisoli TaxID=627624 RepID=UPI001C631997|nr:siderophore-interacting protein [Nocardioides panacisoli]QYJ02961.1 siderophore-interacting protein [Nocardioides panacisoli]